MKILKNAAMSTKIAHSIDAKRLIKVEDGPRPGRPTAIDGGHTTKDSEESLQEHLQGGHEGEHQLLQHGGNGSNRTPR